MPRSKSYQIEDVLSTATSLFLRKGYEATSIGDLVTETKLSRHAIYNEFSDKEGLFLACIQYYILNEQNIETVRILQQDPLGIKNFELFLENRIQHALSDNCYGCLLVNSVVEREVLSARINQRIDTILSQQEERISQCFEAAIKRNEISEINDSKLLSDYFSCFFRGLMNIAKSPQKNKSSLEKMGKMALTAIVK